VTVVASMDDYRKLIADVMATAIRPDATGPQVFENFGPDHARAVIEAMLRAAKQSISIYAEKISTDVYDAELLSAFVSRNPNGKVRIIVDTPDVFTDSNSALCGLQGLLSPTFEVRLTTQHTDHLAVVDEQYTRLEQSQLNRKAIVSFGKNTISAQALNLFNILWGAATPIVPLPRLGIIQS
jgi:hypothetical protein